MRVEVEVPLEFPARAVWRLAGGFDSLPGISSNCVTSRLEEGGRVRILANRDGSILWERMRHFDEDNMSLSYEIIDSKAFSGPYGVGYRGYVSVVPAGNGGSIFHYIGDFEPSPGVAEADAKASIESFAQDCAGGIARVIARQSD